MKITDITTTQLFVPGMPGFMDATIRHRGSGRGALFVHVKTDEGIEGFAPGQADAKGVIEGPLKSVLIGPSLTLPVREGELALGTWQGIYLCEHRDRGGERRLVATLNGEG